MFVVRCFLAARHIFHIAVCKQLSAPRVKLLHEISLVYLCAGFSYPPREYVPHLHCFHDVIHELSISYQVRFLYRLASEKY